MRPPACAFFILLLCLSWATSAGSWGSETGADPYVREACSVTRYQDLCIRSLSSFSHTAKRSPSIWARAGVSVTIVEAKNITQYLNNLNAHNLVKGRTKIALLDCIENFSDTTDNLHKSLGILRRLNAANFDVQMGDVITWLSAALTDEDTCLDVFEEQKGISRRVRSLMNRVSRITYITSNALALANKLASSGLGSNYD